ncbi:hypothetical protein SASPL_124806 [Salvia splendens]|uniref:Clp R domain-containing protein n=1 Tax=Salvia splendens TaxID=180675 RepID=A0A8X8ZP97_SALSN|nr:hypothetical protein SASPL_124806 [Salvia splendens]
MKACALTAGVVKQAVVLAKRRGHAQVTPLHVATTMLASPGGLFRVACQESHSHPLQCKALELCFNVALNRLPASFASQNPSISNALVAAFKRAQANQRRGTTDSQPQQPLVKIQYNHLIVSILDDPSVSRVMREAGFSRNVDVIIKTLITKQKRSVAIVGESTAALSATVKALIRKIERGEVAEPLGEVKVVSIPPLCNLRGDEVEMWMSELSRLVQSLLRRGVVLDFGDLCDYVEKEGSYNMIMEIERLVWGIGEIERFWVMGIATFQTYMRCRDGYNSLPSHHSLMKGMEVERMERWSFHAVWNVGRNFVSKQGICRRVVTSEPRRGLKEESRRLNDKDKKCETVRELHMKWNSFCSSTHYRPSSSSSPFSSGDAMETDVLQKFKEFNSENLNLLCNTLEEKVPSHKQIIPEITGTILQSGPWTHLNQSGMLKRKTQSIDGVIKEDTWLLFLGLDKNQAKEKIARELARIVFGSYSSFTSIGVSGSCIDRFVEAVEADPRRVFLVEDLEKANYSSRMGIKVPTTN